MNDILLSQRVCRTWKRLIDVSPNLQQALFFRPAERNQLDPNLGLGLTLRRRHPNSFNPLLQEIFEEWFHHSGFYAPSITGTEKEYVAHIPMKRDNPQIYTRPSFMASYALLSTSYGF
jgi:hypothetical protein